MRNAYLRGGTKGLFTSQDTAAEPMTCEPWSLCAAF